MATKKSKEVYGPTESDTEPTGAANSIKCGNRKYSVYGDAEHVDDQSFLIHVMHGFALAMPGEYKFQGVRVVVEEIG